MVVRRGSSSSMIAMAESRRVKGLSGLRQAFDEVRFGADRTLNLRESLPTSVEASRRLEAWLRQHQAQRSDELLVITGRGSGSADGIAVIREAAIRVFHALQRKGVVEGFTEHTPGSFVVTVASMQSMIDARRRHRSAVPPPPSPPTLATLSEATRDRLRVLAERSLDVLGVRDRAAFVESEMVRLFGTLTARAGEGADREARLRAEIERAMSEVD
jgi:hypothetical protein